MTRLPKSQAALQAEKLLHLTSIICDEVKKGNIEQLDALMGARAVIVNELSAMTLDPKSAEILREVTSREQCALELMLNARNEAVAGLAQSRDASSGVNAYRGPNSLGALDRTG